MSVLPENGHIDLGSIWYLKGAGRVQTAMAVVLAFHKLGKEAIGLSPTQLVLKCLPSLLLRPCLSLMASGPTSFEELLATDQVQTHPTERPKN